MYVYLQYTCFSSNRSLTFTPSVFWEHSLIIMNYSAYSPITACHYFSIFWDSSSSQFHSCNLLTMKSQSSTPYGSKVPWRACLALLLSNVYSSLFVSNIIFPDTPWCCSCLLHFKSSWFGTTASLIPSCRHGNMRGSHLLPSFSLLPSSLSLALISSVLQPNSTTLTFSGYPQDSRHWEHRMVGGLTPAGR